MIMVRAPVPFDWCVTRADSGIRTYKHLCGDVQRLDYGHLYSDDTGFRSVRLLL